MKCTFLTMSQSVFQVIILICTLMLGASTVYAMDPVRRDFLWDQATAQASQAMTPQAYKQAAQSYLTLIETDELRVPAVLNAGAVLVLAGDSINAIRLFNRAERLVGISIESEAGLAAAYAFKLDPAERVLPWQRQVFRWHYRWGLLDRTTSLCICLMVFFLAATIRRFSWVTASAFFVVLLIGLSVGISWMQELTEAPYTLMELAE